MASEGKIKSKDLSYSASLPPFLQRLHAQKAGASNGDPDRHDYQIARPKKAQTADEEDGPTIVDESGETVSKEEMEKLASNGSREESPAIAQLVRGPSIGEGEVQASGALQEDGIGERKSERNFTDGTATKKRKAAKIVGEDEGIDKEDDSELIEKSVKKIKKKTKPIKLAFDDDGD